MYLLTEECTYHNHTGSSKNPTEEEVLVWRDAYHVLDVGVDPFRTCKRVSVSRASVIKATLE